jgi:hypothetical protein
MPLAVLSRLNKFGLSTNFNNIEIMGEAAAYRAVSKSGVYHQLVTELARAKASRYGKLSPYLRE